MYSFIIGKDSVLAVLKPLLANLITTDVKVPNFRWHSFKVLLLVDVYPPTSLIVGDLFNYIGARYVLQTNSLITSCQTSEP